MVDCVGIAQVCLTCLDTGSEMFSMTEYNVNEAYEHLIGYPLFVLGNLRDSVCKECMQKLTNFSKFRDKSLMVRALLMDLVVQHKVISQQHIDPLRSVLESAAVYVKTGMENTQESDVVSIKNEPADALVKTDVLRDVKLQAGTECRVMLTRLCSAQERTLATRYDNVTPQRTECGEGSISERECRKHEISTCGTIGASGARSPAVLSLRSNISHTDDADVKNTDCNEAILEGEGLEDALSSVINNADSHEDYQLLKKAELAKSETIAPITKHTDVFSLRYRSIVNNSEIRNDKIVRTIAGSHVEKQEFICDSCKRKFKRKLSLIKHIMSNTKNNILVCKEKPFACKLCPYKCQYKYHLNEHIRVHTGEKPFACTVCQYKSNGKSTLKRHMRTHTGEKPFVCNLCQYKCSVKICLKQHMKTHTGEKSLACTLCDYKCNFSHNLKVHMRTHTGEKPYACTLCQYKCNAGGSLKQHMTKHTGEKLFACELCLYKCNTISCLNKHMMKHTGVKPFACTICQYKCNTRYTLKQHITVHSDEKSFACQLCLFKCKTSRSLKQHMRTHTGEKANACK